MTKLELPPSLWAATAAEPPATSPLADDISVDVAVIGGGYAGLSTALHLAEAGRSVQVIEAGEIGWGASGRSGGQVIPGIKYDPDGLVKLFGEEGGRRAAELFGSTAAKVFELIDRHGIDCDDTRTGWAQPAHSTAAEPLALDRCRQWKRLGADVVELTREEMAERLGTDVYHAGWLDRRGGSVQPLSYTRGLARAALKEGAKVATRTRATALTPTGDRWRIGTDLGPAVTARDVIVCTNAHSTGLWPKLEQSMIAANSFQVATTPLASNLSATILRDGVVASDTRRLLSYFRRDREGRFIMGGRGTFAEPRSPADYRHVERMLTRAYPVLSDQPIEFRWGGRVAITRDFLPHLHRPADGLLILVGCQGRGVALQSKMGEWIGDYLVSGDPNRLPLPVVDIEAIPFHALRKLYVSATLAYYKFADIVS
ncbi:NAD(P)/FAD-dependent oxidoreductase [Aureimonas ureilytica]|uniref:NAD(P)/FAD-dependent oxidoreductase n=1 Tax=Aureimonas ureilytica TaxID=401562 RepID=UPI0003632572|nr:FAD-dependent oxidoreductase [Aureimonas ureilytica]